MKADNLKASDFKMKAMDAPIRRASTAVLLKADKVLLLRRSKGSHGGGNWVFPGGVVETHDYVQGEEDLEAAARQAAVRETREEAGLELAASALTFISHWTTPPFTKKRFATWFFLGDTETAASSGTDIEVDGAEIDHHDWVTPQEALDAHWSGEMAMMPPTVVTLSELAAFESAAEAMSYYQNRELPWIEPRMAEVGDGRFCMLYPGDAGYDTSSHNAEGARRRCWLENGVWRYECSDFF